MWNAEAKKDEDEEDEDDSDDSEEEDSDDEAGPSGQAAAELSREQRKKEKKAKKEAATARAKGQAVQVGDLPSSDSEEESDDNTPVNPNHSKASRNQTMAPKPSVDEATEGVKSLSVGARAGAPSRRERDQIEAQAAKERYQKLHEAGKTDAAKADLARLAQIRAKRAEEAARKLVCH
jgi:hypothetical protein